MADRHAPITQGLCAIGVPPASRSVGLLLVGEAAGLWQRDRSTILVSTRFSYEADYFASCLLMPKKAVIAEFNARFGTKHPLVLTDAAAFHLKADAQVLFSQPAGSLLFAEAVAKAQQFDSARFPSLAKFFGVSPRAMAIRLDELGSVAAYLHA